MTETTRFRLHESMTTTLKRLFAAIAFPRTLDSAQAQTSGGSPRLDTFPSGVARALRFFRTVYGQATAKFSRSSGANRRALRVIASPAFSNETLNPYNAMLYRHLEAIGLEIQEFSTIALTFRQVDIWHVHWPEFWLTGPNVRIRLVRAASFLAKLLIARARRVRVILTVHNLKPHDWTMDRVPKFAYEALLRSLSAFVSLSHSARKAAEAQHPILRKIPGFVVPHGHYRGVYPDTVGPFESRRAFALPPTAKTYLFFGLIRPYKNLPALIEVFNAIRDQQSHLLIAGYAPDPSYGDEIIAKAKRNSRIRCEINFVSAERVQEFMRAADVVVLPYEDVLNSGTALLSLSFQRPVVVPDLGSMGELQALFGKDWVHTYRGHLTHAVLTSAMDCARNLDASKLRRLEQSIEALAWPRIAELTAQAYLAVLKR